MRWLACLTIEIGPKRAFPAFAHPKQSFSAIVQLALSLDVLTDVSGTVERDEEEEKTLDQIIDRLIRSAIRALRQAVGSTQIDPPVSSLVRIYAGGARL
ncbi:MAG: hypothetical protein KGK01_14055 [Bradyrhizobium sp.]|uniref:hypothetical protein n=1 Tax=Bradyrhizobium sp. TaxID=376 RepID=UPI00238A84CA|nr:hypothetical protein [Bradyrhizobium sp.]MDE2066133.1 hypothetical protein [Bradyrhizobium sp.]MDE2243504.1 hypothetical protein [Bradyrhizobium sp.]